MSILVTGSNGFVGSNINGDFKATRENADLTNFDETCEYFKSVGPDWIVHAAAKHGNYSQIGLEKVQYFRENVLINVNVFEAARLSGVRNILAFSSVTAFPEDIEYFSEENLYQGPPHDSCYPYAYATRMIEVLCRSYREQYDLNSSSVIKLFFSKIAAWLNEA